MKCRRSLYVSLLICLLPLPSHAAESGEESATPWRVLLVYSYGRDFAPFDAVSTEFRTELPKRAAHSIEFYEVSLDTARQAASNNREEEPLIQYLAERFADRQPDLMVTLGAAATRFFQENRPKLFPSVPLLVAGMEQRMMQDAAPGPREAVVGVRFDHVAVLKTIFNLLPETRNLVVVLGASPYEERWRDLIEQDFRPYADRIFVTYTNNLTVDEMRRLVATLPSDSAVLYHRVAIDAAGTPHEQNAALDELHRAARVPIFGLFENQLGKGIVGGPLMSLSQVGDVSADIAVRILKGESPDKIPVMELSPYTMLFDWRQLERWKIPESRLPPGSTVRYRPVTLWEQHAALVLAGLAIILIQMAFLGALAVQRARLKTAEGEARNLGERLLSANEDERARLARHLHDDFSHRIARLSIETAELERADPDIDGPRIVHNIRQELSRLSEDIHAVSHRLHPSTLEDLGLLDALRTECDQLARSTPLQIAVEFDGVPERLPKEIALCAFRVAQEALRNVGRHARANKVYLSVRGSNGHLSVAVRDDGVGFETTEKPEFVGLGHASMRERVRLLGGVLKIRSAPGQGTTIETQIPLRLH
jgi:signal transduction histidine kinase/ABC-type uncharacterized transport system substrate-binding protein